MARLNKGENAHIDRINELVATAKMGDNRSNECYDDLLGLFKPMILGLCKKWSAYFDDENHRILPLNTLLGECTYWFVHYTHNKYTIDGQATYNKFIKDHMNQRIRYIYECELKYHKRLLFPDPHRDQIDDNSIFDQVTMKYTQDTLTLESGMDFETEDKSKSKLALRIIELLNCDRFNDRERMIFIENKCHGKTHEELAKMWQVSRTRVTQILARTMEKLYEEIEKDNKIWQLLDDANITITNRKLMD